MRLKPILIAFVSFAVLMLVIWQSASAFVRNVEDRSTIAVREALLDNGHDWASVLADGLSVIIEGEAPSEAMRFRAITAAGTVVDAARVIDAMSVKEGPRIAAPDFAIEILRNDSGVSLIGLIPLATDRDLLTRRITRAAAGQPVTDLLQTANYPIPEGWDTALDFAMTALSRLPRSKISVTPGDVAVTAIATSREEQQRLEADLGRMVPLDLSLSMTINAPRPVVTPFTLRFVKDDNGARFDACAADTEAARNRIYDAARAAGATGTLNCTLALGVPSATWGQAASQAIAAVGQLGGGTLTFADADVALIAPEGTDPELFDDVVGRLSNSLPDVFVLDATLPVAVTGQSGGAVEFSIALGEDGATLRGRVADALMNQTAETFARASFGADRVTMSTRIAPAGLAQGWSTRILAGIEAASHLARGTVRVRPDGIAVSGVSGEEDAQDTISRILIDKLGQTTAFTLEVVYDEAYDPIAALPTAEECVARIQSITAARKITFDPGSATISSQGMAVISEIAEVLRACAELRLQIAGYTDSQGSDEGNLRLSQSRAEAVLTALRGRRVPVSGFVAQGFGEADPIADNDTEEGREANRRIEFTLIGAPAPAGSTETASEAEADQPFAKPDTRPRLRPEGLAADAETDE